MEGGIPDMGEVRLMSVETTPDTWPDSLVSVAAEASLLGAMLIGAPIADQLGEVVSGDDFVEPLHGRIFDAIQHEVAAGRRATVITVAQMLANDVTLQALNGVGYLASISGNNGAIIGARENANLIADLAKRRRLLTELRELSDSIVTDCSMPIEQLVAGIDGVLNTSLQHIRSTKSLSLAQAFDVTMKSIEDEAAGLTPPGINVAGLDDWNELTGGMRPGEVTVLAARPGMGKTAAALSVALGAARAGHGTLLVSLEMTTQELMKRAIADLCYQRGNAPSFEQVKSGTFSAFDRERLAEVRAEIETWPMQLTDPSKLRIGRLAMDIRRYQRRMVAKGQKLELVTLDYLGLIKSDDPRANRYQGVGEVSRAIKEVAKECGVHILLLAQLNRECEKREDKRPQLSDLRDSGDIEQDADTVVFLYREEYYLQQSEPDESDSKYAQWYLDAQAARDRIEIIVSKRRNGKTAKRLCYFFASHQAVRGSKFYSEVSNNG
jgi:replicative DNA helicase